MAKKPKAKDIIADYQRILNDVKARKFKPIYLLMGDEPVFIDKIANALANDVLSESEKAFNLTILYGKDTKVDAAITACRRFPMMSDYQVIIIREAQDLSNINQLEVYFKSPLKSTILVICLKGKTMDKRSVAYKEVVKQAEVFETYTFYDNEIPEWINLEAKSKGITIQDKAAILLSEFLGNDLSKISHEIEKLKTVIPSDRKQITVDDIERNVGISKDYNVFELCNAIGKRDFVKSYKIADYFAKSPKDHPFIVTIGQLYTFFSKVLKLQMLNFNAKKPGGKIASEAEKLAKLGISSSFFLKDYEEVAKKYSPPQSVKIIEYLREYDLKSKGIGSNNQSEEDLLKELIFKIMH
ncbi:DNA polymerase III subunit delta [Alistipes sp. ZOR0009]|uniref:DNA polymerase III subunit delta n=1 Tax=Alistipes sp. ZOR0009 TaxID=1339253 RepID=UPI00068BC353|nr:DNA polymerase III subunit delta [Alistipes sp. ZOR0009]